MANYILHPSEIVFCGDFNIHMDDVDNQAAKRFKDLLSFGLHQHVHEPTHKHGHCLDLLITRDTASLLCNIEILPGLSDHCAVVCNINLQKPPLRTIAVKLRNWKSIQISQFSKDVNSAFIKADFSNLDLDSSIEKYESIMRDTVNMHAPLKCKVKKVKASNPWFNDEIRSARKVRRQLERKWMRSRLEVDRQEGEL